jgi:hypothetical protein
MSEHTMPTDPELMLRLIYAILGGSDPNKPGTMTLAIARARWDMEAFFSETGRRRPCDGPI